MRFHEITLVAMFDAVRATIDGQANGWIELYPDDTSDASTLIGVIPLPTPCGEATTSGLILAGATAQATGTGAPAWGRLMSASGACVLEGACGEVFLLQLEMGETVYPGGDLIFSGGLIGF